ncbi:MAG TPA: Holliday junction resolvase RuvX [Ktedonobacteraceae bacterium]|jgi:putative Holliday junction resolvase|nr:Holliday junction resolvase RuvX [Ktedonobacteraceae bacterium]
MARLMALDVGEVRIGVAVSDATGMLASPYTILRVTRNEEQTWEAIARLIEETEAEGLVIGLPISLDGQIHAQGERILAFAERLKQHVTLPITFWDERLSTVEAQRLLRERDMEGKQAGNTGRRRASSSHGHQPRRRKKGQEIDAMAAAVFLQEYLDAHASEKRDRTL